MYKKGLLFEKKKKKKSYKKGDFAKLAHGVEHPGDPDPTGSREKAKAGQEQDVLKAKKSGKPLTNWIEGRTKKQKAGDDELESHVRDFAKKHGVGYTEKSMEPKGASSKKGRKRERTRQNYDFNNPTKKGTQAYPEDFGGKSNKLSRQVKKDNKTRVRHGEKAYFKNKEKGGESTAVIGSGLKALDEKRRHPRNEAERVLRQQDRHQRGTRRAEQLRGLEAAGGTNAPKGHTRKAGNALQRLNQKQDSKAGKENTRVRHVKNHIMMGIRDKDGQLTPKASKTYTAHRKANLQRKREKRQFNQSMGTEESGFKKIRKD